MKLIGEILSHQLERRDPQVVSLLPRAVARAIVALPIGRMRDGELIVCVRDPSDTVRSTLANALVGERIALATAAASVIEPLVEHAYPELAAPDFGSMTLVDLDDSSVEKDHTQSGQFAVRPEQHNPLAVGTVLPRTTTPSPLTGIAPRTASKSPADLEVEVDMDVDIDIEIAAAPIPPRATTRTAPAAHTLTEALVALEAATSRDAATEIAMTFAARRWRSAALFTIEEGNAKGHQGHGTVPPAVAVQSIAIPLAGRSILRAAHDVPDTVARPPVETGPIEERIHRLLGCPTTPMAFAIAAGTDVAGILVVGDPTDTAADASTDLEHLGVGLGDAYARVGSDRKPST